MKLSKIIFVIACLFTLVSCGVETATTAATGAAIKKNEVDEGKKTLERSQAKVQDAVQQVQDRAGKNGDP